MSGFNFGQIGNIMSELFDTDYIDIKRDISGQVQEIYSNITCHIAYNSSDNPDPTTIDIKPVVQSLIIHLPLWVDIKNNDFLIAKKMSNDGNLLKTYSGRCGNPVVSQGRQKVVMNMIATESEEPTPVPPKNPVVVFVDYFSNDAPIQDSISFEVEKNSNVNLTAPAIDNYSPIDCLIDGVSQSSTVAVITDIEEGHTIRFVYEATNTSTGFRFLVKGLYTKNDGSLANGWHLYKKLDIDSISEENDVYTVVCDNYNIEHEDNGKKLVVKVGAELVLVPNFIYVKVLTVSVANGKVTFTATEFEPSNEQLQAYVTDWYD